MKFLILGDVMGSVGRAGVSKVLPRWREELQVDSVIINIENMAHGRGISPDTMQEALTWKADVYTTGDHAWDNQKGVPLLDDEQYKIIRPANYPPQVAGKGWRTYSQGMFSVAVINLQGQVMFKNDPNNPFVAIDEILQEPEVATANVVLVDFHAEATSEKRGFGWYVDGRVSAVWGTHTHVPTADEQILPGGTGYISDVGMNGAYDSIIGMDKAAPLKMFRTQLKAKMEPPESGEAELNGICFEIDPQSGKTVAVTRVREILAV